MQVNPSTWYAGTPEADRFNSQELGQVLLVEIAGPGATPIVSTRPTGTYRWITLTEEITMLPISMASSSGCAIFPTFPASSRGCR
jgi:hypothetical protein